jgi:hypothetical protein
MDYQQSVLQNKPRKMVTLNKYTSPPSRMHKNNVRIRIVV